MKNKLLLLPLLLIPFFVNAQNLTQTDIQSQASTTQERFIVDKNATDTNTILNNLYNLGYIKDINFVKSELQKNNKSILPGAYKISKISDDKTVAMILSKDPYMKWVFIKPGLRKEEVANILATNLNWKGKDLTKNKSLFLNYYKKVGTEYSEGVYLPETYLIPTNESGEDIAKRMINKFNENFLPLQKEFAKQNIKWTTALKMASLVQREAANKDDMPLIAGILWNRLDQNMLLNIDATLQYARGDKTKDGNGYWSPITIADKKTNSPYNTYRKKGLPPTPIANPSLDAIRATLYPASTTCVYYLHDKNSVDHCANTYEEHLQNIEIYLKATSTKTN